jgi:hypothetical protein
MVLQGLAKHGRQSSCQLGRSRGAPACAPTNEADTWVRPYKKYQLVLKGILTPGTSGRDSSNPHQSISKRERRPAVKRNMKGSNGKTGSKLIIGLERSGNAFGKVIGSQYILPNNTSTGMLGPASNSRPNMMAANMTRRATRCLSMCLSPFQKMTSLRKNAES